MELPHRHTRKAVRNRTITPLAGDPASAQTVHGDVPCENEQQQRDEAAPG